MKPYPKRFGDSGPEYIIDLDGPDGNVYNLFNAIETVMGDEKYIEEAKNAEHYTNPADCAYEGYERILDYMLTMCPEIELRFNGKEIQQVYPCWHDAVCQRRDVHKAFHECQIGSRNEYNSRMNGFV